MTNDKLEKRQTWVDQTNFAVNGHLKVLKESVILFKLLAMSKLKSMKIMETVGVRYIVRDVDSSVSFYTEMLGFHADQHVKSAFASLSLGNLKLFINNPGAGGAGQAMPDGTLPAPGGWNRIQFMVEDLEMVVKDLKSKGAKFRNEIVIGVGGNQILLEDPSGNLIELFQPAAQ
jgi:catechol 2,3-dioxygenase-like lactoylglutathione lyase family enzyme